MVVTLYFGLFEPNTIHRTTLYPHSCPLGLEDKLDRALFSTDFLEPLTLSPDGFHGLAFLVARATAYPLCCRVGISSSLVHLSGGGLIIGSTPRYLGLGRAHPDEVVLYT